MCMNCGCGAPEDRHGDPANITATDLRRAGEANGQTLAETMRNLNDAYGQVQGQEQGQGASGAGGGSGSGR
ncbi:MAG: hypothetical protein U0869_16345 [Chloroflexota bacterium]